MTVFYLIFILLAAYFSFRYDGIEEYDSHKQHRLWLMCAYLVCLTGFSYGLGADKFTYMYEFGFYPSTFAEAPDFIWLQFMMKGQMPLWTIVNLFCKIVFDSFYAVQIIESLAINTTVCYLVSKYTHRYFLFLLIYFFSLQYFIFNTEVMREGFAMAFVLLGLHGWMTGRKWLYFVTLPVGVLFHVSAAVNLLFPFANLKITWRTLGYAVFASFAIWFLSDVVLSRIMVLALGGMGAIVAKVLIYSVQATNFFGFIRYVVTYLVFPFIVMYTVMQHPTCDAQRTHLQKLISYMIFLGIIAGAMPGFIRFFNYMQIFYLIMLADFVYMMFSFKEHLIIRMGTLMGTVFIIGLLYMIRYKTTNSYYYHFFYPYTCILYEDESVYFREIAHQEALIIEANDDNVRDIE